jgi:hypothetical protein
MGCSKEMSFGATCGCGMWRPQAEKIDHPAHYGGEGNPYEAIKVIEAWKLGFNLGNTVKYISRWDKKGFSSTVHIEDLKKALWYLDREIKNMEKTRDA